MFTSFWVKHNIILSGYMELDQHPEYIYKNNMSSTNSQIWPTCTLQKVLGFLGQIVYNFYLRNIWVFVLS